MQPPPIVQSLRVFLASPGGVEPEREAVRAIVEELNGALLPHGWQIVPLGWEQRGPAAGRAQADINADVRACDIFLGVLWDRWGSPTGDHGSGFEEEWAIALERHRSSGSPDLWLYFKRLAKEAAEKARDDRQLDRVLEFRREVEDGDLAFHRSFEGVDDLTSLVRVRLLTEVIERTGLTRTDIGVVAIDWAAAYEQEPLDLIPDGRARLQLVHELEAAKPGEAARLAVDLADDAERQGFAPTAEQLRERACQIWLTAGEAEAAMALLRRILARYVWELRAEETEILLRQLQEQLPPELAVELRAWRACLAAPDKPAHAAAALDEALRAQHGFALDADTVSLWRAVRWRSLLEAGEPNAVIADEVAVEPRQGDVQLELALLRADALRAGNDERADEAWRDLRLVAVDAAIEEPERAAWIATRVALDALARGDLEAAEIAYADAATRWTSVPGATANSALAFFSAQAAVQLRRDLSFSGWSWRPIAAQQRGGPTGLTARAEELERDALYERLEERADSLSLLRAALWCYLRAGFAHGVIRCRALLADAYAAEGDDVSAIALHCEIAHRSAAEKLAAKAKDARAVADLMAAGFPAWAAEARFAVVTHVGGHTSPPAARTLAREALDAVARGEQRQFDNTPGQAAEALAMLSVAVEDATVLQAVETTLDALSRDQRYAQAKAGRFGLRLLHDIGRIDAADTLVACFASDDRPDEPDSAWVAEHVDSPRRLEWVRRAALAGSMRPLAALIHAGFPERDEQIRALCLEATKHFLASNIGMTPDGSGMWGLMALDLNGRVAAATGDGDLRCAAAERLLVYAADSRWPMVNRVSAVRGVYALAQHGGEAGWLDRLRPLAHPERDLDEEAAPHSRELWAERGDLEAIALTVCALLGAADPPAWLDEAVGEARFDARVPLREGAWHAAGERAGWFDVGSARQALRDDSQRVRVAALHAWRKQGGALPRVELRRLVADGSGAVRMTLLRLLEDATDKQATEILLRDSDAYVRGVARKRLVCS